MIMRFFVAMLVLVQAASVMASDFDHQHSAFTALLQQHVRQSSDATASTVNYAALKQDGAALKKYLAALSAVQRKDFDGWSADPLDQGGSACCTSERHRRPNVDGVAGSVLVRRRAR